MDRYGLGETIAGDRRVDRHELPWDVETRLAERPDRIQMIVCPSCMQGIQISARRGNGECPACRCSFRLH